MMLALIAYIHRREKIDPLRTVAKRPISISFDDILLQTFKNVDHKYSPLSFHSHSVFCLSPVLSVS